MISPACPHPCPVTDTVPAAEPFPTRWVFLLGFAAAAIAALTISAQIYLSMRGHGQSAARIFVWQLAGWGFWALLAHPMKPFVRRVWRAKSGCPIG